MTFPLALEDRQKLGLKRTGKSNPDKKNPGRGRSRYRALGAGRARRVQVIARRQV